MALRDLVVLLDGSPRDETKLAVAVDLERSDSGQSGGAVAAPIARDVVQTLLSEGK